MSNTTLSFVGQVFFPLNIYSLFKCAHSQVGNKCKEGISNLSRLRGDPQCDAVVKNRPWGIGAHRLGELSNHVNSFSLGFLISNSQQ